jgi:1-deoxy-D-xylulose-5-phosphate reductoisomerase
LKNLVILGSSGSIGQNALWVADRFPEELNIFGLSVNSNIKLLAEQIRQFHPQVVCVADDKAASKFASEAKSLGVELLTGKAGLETLAAYQNSEIILNAVVGFVGLRSTLAAARAGKRIALANKDSMVAGGELVNSILAKSDGEIIPIDSEHSAIFQCLKAGVHDEVKRLILTSSGGPFRQYPLESFPSITVEHALRHPTWNMGKKITIDSATLMNKGLEIIEAVYLFNISADKIDVVIHPQSIVHSMVEFVDGATVAQLSKPDMRLPIQYALFYPERRALDVAALGFDESITLEFQPPDNAKFPSLNLAREAIKRGGTAPAIYNAANEIAVESFLEHRISFPDIFGVVDYALGKAGISRADSLDSIVSADKTGRELARQFTTTRSV